MFAIAVPDEEAVNFVEANLQNCWVTGCLPCVVSLLDVHAVLETVVRFLVVDVAVDVMRGLVVVAVVTVVSLAVSNDSVAFCNYWLHVTDNLARGNETDVGVR